MTFYQELQLNQAGSKAYIASFKDPKEKFKHIGIYLFKIIITIAFCTAFITLFSLIFGSSNSLAGLAVLLSIMAFRYSDFGIRSSHAIFCVFAVFGILAIGPKLANSAPIGLAFCINVICIMLLMLLGSHNVVMFNHSTFVLSYLLLQGYDVSGKAYKMRLIGLFVGAVITSVILYHNHRKITYKRSLKTLFQEFNLSSTRTRWQLRLTFSVSSVMLIAAVLGVPKAYWMGIAAMSVTFPFRNDLVKRVKYRGLGSIAGSILFLVVYLLLPESCRSYMGIIGGIGMGLSVHYGWQTAFNSFSALSIAVPVLGLKYAILFRIFNNIFASAYT
ncbi:MAG: FUSC family protein, partial [Oscillospiraceae bacterium]|nr:FUSC family protein [Oscillospiraceae bacterium]